MPDDNNNEGARFAKPSRNSPAQDSLFHRFEDMAQQVRSLHAGEVRRSPQQIGVHQMETHHLPQVGLIDPAPTNLVVGHSVGVFEQEILRKCRGCV